MTQEDAFLAAIVQEGGRGASHLVYADWLDEQGRNTEAAQWQQGRVLLSASERMLILWLPLCLFAPGTADKGFVLDQCRISNGFRPWTVRQWAYLWQLGWRYRRQSAEPLTSAHPTAEIVATLQRAALLNGKEAGPTPAPARTLDL